MKLFNTTLAAFCLTGVAFSAPTIAAESADQYPSRAIRLIVPFAPGGGADLNARKIAQPLSEKLGQNIIIDNRPGAGGTLGANQVVRSEPDGYTLLYTTPGQQMTAPYLIPKLPYDALNDLRPVSMLTMGFNVLVINNDLPLKSVQELIDYAKANPGKLSFASSGIGSTSHLAGELFKKMADIDIVHVPYKGTGPAMNDLRGGRVHMAIDTLSIYLPQIRSGNVRALGIASTDRNPMAPEIPPIADTLPGFEASPINYLSVPAKTPDAIVLKLSQALREVLNEPKLSQEFLNVGSRLNSTTPEEMQQVIQRETKKWKAVIESANIQVQ